MAIKREYREMVGKKFGRLTVEKIYRGEHSLMKCDCICECGNRKDGIYAYNILFGRIRSCGCLRRENHKDKIEKKYDDIGDMIDRGMGISEIARVKGVSRQMIYKVCEERGIDYKSRRVIDGE